MSLPRTNRALEAVSSQWAYSVLPQSVVGEHMVSLFQCLLLINMKHGDFKLAPFSCFVAFIVLRVDIIQGFSFAEKEKEKKAPEMAMAIENKVNMKASR